MTPLPLEDTFTDILGKASRGLKLDEAALATRTHLPAEQVSSLLAGDLDLAALRQVAPALGLNAEALLAVAQKTYVPKPVALEGLAQFTTPFDDMMVNNYVAWDTTTGQAVAFDTGADAGPLLYALEAKKLKLELILLTHTHGDHILDLDRLKETTHAPAWVGDREPLDGVQAFPAGRTFKVGSLTIESRLTWGHSKGGITFVIKGLKQPVAIVGDAVFAGSMGGGSISYTAALETNRSEIFTLPENTILCPGHGPLTTIAEEKRSNPFFAIQ